MIDVWPRLELHRVWWEPPPVYAAVAGQPVVLAEFPTQLNIPIATNGVPFMYFSIWHWPLDDQRLQRLYAAELRRSDGGPAAVSCAGDDRPAAGERRHARDRQLRAVHHRLRADSGGARCLSGLSAHHGGQWEGQPVRLYELVR